MRTIILLFIGMILFSCGSESEEQTTSNSEVEPLETESTEIPDDEIYVPEEPVLSTFDISEMPRKWILAETDEGGNFVIYDYWDSQGEAIEFEAAKGDDWYLNIYHAQDTEQALIQDFEATITEGEGISMVEGSFFYMSQWNDERVDVAFTWDQMFRQVAEFKGLPNGTDFIPEEKADQFETIVVEREEDGEF